MLFGANDLRHKKTVWQGLKMNSAKSRIEAQVEVYKFNRSGGSVTRELNTAGLFLACTSDVHTAPKFPGASDDVDDGAATQNLSGPQV